MKRDIGHYSLDDTLNNKTSEVVFKFAKLLTDRRFMTTITVIQMIITISNSMGFDPSMALAIAQTESNLNVNAVGTLDDLGLFQLRARSYPNYTKEELLNPIINTQLAIKHLLKVKENCIHRNNNDWLTCYNVGLAGAKKIKYPSIFPYTLKVSQNYNKIKEEMIIVSVPKYLAFSLKEF